MLRPFLVTLALLLLCVACSKPPEPILNEVELKQAIKQLQADQALVRARMEVVQRSQDSKELRALDESLSKLDYSITVMIRTVQATLENRPASPIVSDQRVLE